MTIAITGATGQLGGRVASAMRANAPRLVLRDPSRAPEGFELAVATYGELDAATRALDGIDTLFMVSAAESSNRREEHRTFIRAAAEAGVQHIIYTSFLGADPDAGFTLGRDHADAEAAIRASGMRFTLLRDNFYADILPMFADDSGTIRGPAGDGRLSAVARADVADVASAVLRAPEAHLDAVYELTGPQALTLDEITARLTVALGREFRYERETVEEAYQSRRAFSTEQWQLDAWVSTYTAIADGETAALSPDVEAITGHSPRTLEQALAEH